MSIKLKDMKKPSKEQKEFESELIYYLRLYNELKNREGSAQVLRSIEEEIDKLISILKRM